MHWRLLQNPCGTWNSTDSSQLSSRRITECLSRATAVQTAHGIMSLWQPAGQTPVGAISPSCFPHFAQIQHWAWPLRSATSSSSSPLRILQGMYSNKLVLKMCSHSSLNEPFQKFARIKLKPHTESISSFFSRWKVQRKNNTRARKIERAWAPNQSYRHHVK